VTGARSPGLRSRKVAGLVTLLTADALAARGSGDDNSSDSSSEGRSPSHRRAVRIRTLMEDLGPFYVKLGQMLATRPDIVTQGLMDELGSLHRSVRPAPFALFAQVLDEQLGPGWRRELRDVDVATPLGSASLAQVYRATRPDGSVAVVKIQRPGARARMLADMAALRRAARVVGRTLPGLDAVLDIDATLHVLSDAMQPELDFRVEAANMDAARAATADFDLISVPEVVRAAPQVLVQGLAPGYLIGSAEAASLPACTRRAVGSQLLAFMYRGYFTDRFFHADPHPGNVFVHPDHGATLIDWGMVGRLDRNLSALGMMILTSLAQNDARGLVAAWVEMGRATTWADLPGFQEDMSRLVPRISAASLDNLNFGVALGTILRQSARRGIRTSPMIGLLGKSFANIEGSVRLIAPELSIVEVFREALTDVMVELAREAVSVEQAARTALDVMVGGTIAADQVRAILREVSGREATVRVGLLPGHGIGGEGDHPIGRYWPHLAAGSALLWFLRRETRHRSG
jgi:ubiquinone biosynthesis protein